MARYIDADKFIAELEQEKTAALDFGDGVAAYEIEHMMNLIGMQPSADVVPKSEVESLKEMLEAAIAGQETLQKALAKAKTDVAREIFEEIEKILSKSRERYSVGGYHYDHYKRDNEFVEAFAELKKKYTEGE